MSKRRVVVDEVDGLGSIAAEPLLLRPAEVARLLAISRSKLYGLISADAIPGVIRIGSSIRVSRRALESWIASETADPQEDATARRRA